MPEPLKKSDATEFISKVEKMMRDIENNTSVEFQPEHWQALSDFKAKVGLLPSMVKFARRELGLEARWVLDDDDSAIRINDMEGDYLVYLIAELRLAGYQTVVEDRTLRHKK